MAEGRASIRVGLPTHLRTLAKVSGEVRIEVARTVTPETVLDALEAAYPALRGTARDPASGRRRPFVRFYVDSQDLSHEPMDAPLPAPVVTGEVPFRIVGAMAGG